MFVLCVFDCGEFVFIVVGCVAFLLLLLHDCVCGCCCFVLFPICLAFVAFGGLLCFAGFMRCWVGVCFFVVCVARDRVFYVVCAEFARFLVFCTYACVCVAAALFLCCMCFL